MPEYKIDEEGVLLDEEGNQVTFGEGDEAEPIKVGNAVTQEKTEHIIKDRLARQQQRIESLEAQANRTPELERQLQEDRQEKQRLEQELENAQSKAQEEVSSQLQQYRQQVDKYASELEQERQARMQDQVRNKILANAGEEFLNPDQDVVPVLLRSHKREQKRDENGKVIKGEYVDLFEMTYEDAEGNEVKEAVPLSKALEIFANKPQNQHYLKAKSSGGSGGGKYANVTHKKRSDMTRTEKSQFISEHGREEYMNLPE